MLVVQGGPGTGKTVVALHRAAYLLYTHRFPLEGQGVLVVGPNRLFLGYIEQVLPSLGEAGVELAVLADLLDGTTGVDIEGRDRPATARVKGDLRMAKVLAKAVRDRQRPLRARLASATACRPCSLTPSQSQAHRRRRPAPLPARTTPGRKLRRGERVRHAGRQRPRCRSRPTRCATGSATPPRCARRSSGCGRCSRPAELLHDLFGSRGAHRAGRRPALARADGAGRARAARGPSDVDDAVWTNDDVPLLDEARALLGPEAAPAKRPGRADRRRRPHLRPHRRRRGPGPLADAAAHARRAARSTAR